MNDTIINEIILRQKRLDISAINEFIPWLLKGFEQFYGKENIGFIEERVKNVLIFPYFSESKNKEAEVDEQLKILFQKMELIDKEPLNEEDVQSATKSIKTAILEKYLQSGCSIHESNTKGIIPLILIDMSEYNFYPRLIHEFVHAIDGNIKDKVEYSGFAISKDGKNKKNRMFNEYFTDKIAIDIYNWLIEQDCPLLKDKEQIRDRSLSNGGVYWAPDAFLNEFYQNYKREVCTCKLKNSHEIFDYILDKENAQKVMDACDFIASSFYIGADSEQMDKAIEVKNKCKQLILESIEKTK